MVNSCPCNPEGYPFVCPVHGKRMSPHLVHLCQTRPDYRELWIQRASGVEHEPAPPPAPRQSLQDWLREHADRLHDSEDHQDRYRTLRAALAIVDGHCRDCPDFDPRRETCRRCRGCRGVGEATYRHSLLSILGRCPLGFW
jgi:hypothetical protein